MKAPAFAYLKAESVDEAIAALAQHGDSAQVLAGGQSLMPLLNLRMAAPSVLVDITGLSELREIRIVGDRLRIGALTTHRQIQESARVRDHVPLLAQAVPHVAHMAIRNQGTIGGSLSLADPAAEYPVVALALQAVIELRGPKGVRRVNADDYFLGLYTTARTAEELLVAVEFPIAQASHRAHFDELSRRRGDYGMIGLGAVADVEGKTLKNVRLAWLAVGDRPTLSPRAMAALEGKTADAATIAAAQAALAQDLDPSGDLHADAATRKHLARVLLGRAITALGA